MYSRSIVRAQLWRAIEAEVVHGKIYLDALPAQPVVPSSCLRCPNLSPSLSSFSCSNPNSVATIAYCLSIVAATMSSLLSVATATPSFSKATMVRNTLAPSPTRVPTIYGQPTSTSTRQYHIQCPVR
ncbi:hypothetical protein ACLOJK_038792 [Asimina triloba]